MREHEPQIPDKEKQSFLRFRSLRDFVERREIRPEDYSFIEGLLRILGRTDNPEAPLDPDSLAFDHHNTLSLPRAYERDAAVRELSKSLLNCEQRAQQTLNGELRSLWERRAAYARNLIEFAERYDGAITHDLIRSLEEVPPQARQEQKAQ